MAKRLDEGFSASKARDEELKHLMELELEADKRMRESFKKHFDEADRKHNEQIASLKDLLHDLSSPK